MVYRNMEQQKEKWTARLIAILEGTYGSRRGPGGGFRRGYGGKGRGKGMPKSLIGETQCAYC